MMGNTEAKQNSGSDSNAEPEASVEEKLQNEIAALVAQQGKIAQRLEALQAAFTALQPAYDAIDEQRTQAAAVTAEVTKLQKELDDKFDNPAFAGQAEVVKRVFEEQTASITKLDTDLATLKSQSRSLETKSEKLAQETSQLQQDMTKAQEELAALSSEIEEKSASITQLIEQVRTANSEGKNIDTLIRLAELKESVEKFKTLIASEEVTRRETAFTTAQNAYNTKSDEAEQAHTDLEQHRVKIEGISTRLAKELEKRFIITKEKAESENPYISQGSGSSKPGWPSGGTSGTPAPDDVRTYFIGTVIRIDGTSDDETGN